MVHINHCAAFGDKLQLLLRHPWMIGRVMDELHPHTGQHEANHTHYGKDMFPAPGEGQPAEQRREDRQRKILRGVKDGRRRATLFGREPGGHNTGVCRERRRFRETKHKTHDKHRHACPGQREDIDKTLQEGEQRPEKQAIGIDLFGAKLIQQPAAGDLHQQVRPAKRGEDVTHRYGAQL